MGKSCSFLHPANLVWLLNLTQIKIFCNPKISLSQEDYELIVGNSGWFSTLIFLSSCSCGYEVLLIDRYLIAIYNVGMSSLNLFVILGLTAATT